MMAENWTPVIEHGEDNETGIKLGFHRYGCGMQMRMRLADASSGMRFV